MSIVFSKHFILDAIAENESTIAHLVSIFESNGSNWKLNRVLGPDLRVAKYEPFKGSSFVESPQWIKNKGCVINIKSRNKECLKWALLCALHHKNVRGKNLNRISH